MRVIVSRLLLAVALTVVLLPADRVVAQRPRPWPPGVQAAPDSAPVRSPEEELSTFVIAPGYRVQLVAAEPLVQDPVAIDWDTQGRLWVVEMPGFMPDIAATGEHDPVGRVVTLADTDGDGRMDRRTVFADGLVLARSVKVLEHGVLVAEPPDLWLMRDTDGDGRADTRTRVTDQFGRRDIDVENNANGFDWGLDNRIRTAGQSRLHLRWSGGSLVTAPSPTRGQWGVTHDDVGRTFRNTNESALHVDLIPGEYFTRHPSMLRTRGSDERLSMPGNELNAVWPVRPTPGINRGYQAGIRRADGTLARHTSVCAPLVVRGDRIPGLQGDVLVADPAANLVSRIVLREEGRELLANKAWPDAELLASTDERFRPVHIANAPDGTVYIADLYRGVIEHRLSLTTYLKAYIERHGLIEPRGLGRIWRIVEDGTARDTTPMSTTTDALVGLLAHPNGWRRDAAQRILIERADPSVEPALRALLRTASAPSTRLHALWTLDGLDLVTEPLVIEAMGDRSPHVRGAAVRIAERWLESPEPDLRAAIDARAADEHPLVRLQVAATLGTLPNSDEKWTRMARLLARDGDDPVLVDAVISGVRGGETALLEHAVGHAPADAVAMIAATLFRGGVEHDVQTWLARIADDATPDKTRAALMHGAEIGILGAPVPGQLPPLPAAPGVTCPTCPGGRLSTGGEYAYTFPASARRPGLALPPLRLTRMPASFIALAERDTPLARHAAAVLTRITWPGKPGDADAPPPLTTDEQARFERGRTLYEAMCQACHQADGRGQAGRAASLVGSPLALAKADVPIRVLLHGKEGATGLMPPLGSTLGDEEVAAVLTYVRRAWGHGATAVTPGDVARTRRSTRDRTRPWTDDELTRRTP